MIFRTTLEGEKRKSDEPTKMAGGTSAMRSNTTPRTHSPSHVSKKSDRKAESGLGSS